MKGNELRVPAIEVRQSPDRLLYSFALDGKLIPSFAAISRVHRRDAQLEGYQRPEVLAHIAEIRDYLESESPMIPNAVVIAFDKRVRFESTGEAGALSYARHGILVIPIDAESDDAQKPGFVVDGQQRLAAIRDAAIDEFPICVSAFIAHGVRDQIEQFILVNSTKPLPKGLIYELLPSTETTLPSLLRRRRFPAYLLDRLNRDEDSPLAGLIQTPTTPQGIIKDNSILKMLENSLSDGALYRFRQSSAEHGDAESMLTVLKAFWGACRDVFPEAWGVPPKRSRLMHGAGIVTMGFLMDAISDRHRSERLTTTQAFRGDLGALKPECRWTDGYWIFGPGRERKWNEIQNTSKDIQLLSNHLLVLYRAAVRNLDASGEGRDGPPTGRYLQFEA
jgi:DGQHR domain-containing protein